MDDVDSPRTSPYPYPSLGRFIRVLSSAIAKGPSRQVRRNFAGKSICTENIHIDLCTARVYTSGVFNLDTLWIVFSWYTSKWFDKGGLALDQSLRVKFSYWAIIIIWSIRKLYSHESKIATLPLPDCLLWWFLRNMLCYWIQNALGEGKEKCRRSFNQTVRVIRHGK